METPGFEMDKMSMSDQEKASLPDKDLKSQIEREMFQEDMQTSPDSKFIGKIQEKAANENFDRAQVDEQMITARIRGDINYRNMTEQSKLEAAQKKLTEAYDLIDENRFIDAMKAKE